MINFPNLFVGGQVNDLSNFLPACGRIKSGSKAGCWLRKTSRSCHNDAAAATIVRAIAAMTARLLRMPATATEIWDEAIARLDAAKKFASSPVVDRLVANGDDDAEDDRRGTDMMLEAAE